MLRGRTKVLFLGVLASMGVGEACEVAGTCRTRYLRPPLVQPVKGPLPRIEADGTIKLPCVADNTICYYKHEKSSNQGGRDVLMARFYENFPIFRFDTRSLKGRTVKKAWLVVRLHKDSPGPPKETSLSTVTASWREGTYAGLPSGDVPEERRADSYQKGASNYYYAAHLDRRWTHPESNFMSAVFDRGNSLSHFLFLPREPEFRKSDDRWLSIPVPPRMIHLLAVGAHHGLALWEESWGKPKVWFDSRESNHPPYLLVKTERTDGTPPDAVRSFAKGSEKDPYPLLPGEVRLRWKASGDDGKKGRATAYRITATSPDGGTMIVPAWLTPLPGEPGDRQETVIEGLVPGLKYTFTITVLDEAGHTSRPATLRTVAREAGAEDEALARIAAWRAPKERRVQLRVPPTSSGGSFRAWPVPAGPRIGPVGGNLLEDGKEAYGSPKPAGRSRCETGLWSSKDGVIKLDAGRQEFVSLQMAVERIGDPIKGVRVRSAPWSGPGKVKPAIRIFRYQYVLARPRVKKKEKWEPKPPDFVAGPLIELGSEDAVALPVDDRMPWQKVQGFWMDVYVSPKTKPGDYETILKLDAGNDALAFPLRLRVHPYRLPDQVRFALSLNAYGVPGGVQGNPALQRLAHEHRGCLNGLICGRSGSVRGIPLTVVGEGEESRIEDFEEFDSFWGPYFDGSAFRDLPRAGVPLDHYYFPLEMRFPVKLDDHYDDTRPNMEEAFTSSFRVPYVAAARSLIQHYAKKNWKRTKFHMYLNYSFKTEKAQSTSYYSQFHFDESKYRSDFQAHAIYARLLKKAKEGIGGVHVGYRMDIGRNEFMRTYVDGLLDLNVSSGGSWRNPGFNRRRDRRFGEELWSYGSSRLDSSAVLLRAWALKAFALGCDGIMPWNSIAREGAMTRAQASNNVSIIYPPSAEPRTTVPSPSIRLKMLRRGVQDVELLINVMQKHKLNRFALEDVLKQVLGRRSEVALDAAGVAEIKFSDLTVHALDDFRMLLIRLACER